MPHFLARVLRDYYGERCLRCGWSKRHPKTGKVPIEVEHIDGNWQNSRLTNLTLLCPNCHALTLTYRGLNRGRGREYRLKGSDHAARGRLTNEALQPTGKKVRGAAALQLELLTPT
ncbi:MAG TPA: HNH endonuclease [Candidatus Cybelea sp.]|jgi:predicted restriction endonuclease|nr:HNH endonuclease [Candidatus Cybelea sp.]